MFNEFMNEAIREAQKAAELNEVPIGAVIVCADEILGRGHNLVITRSDPTAHAEILAIRQASEALAGERLNECEMYVTLEPCSMCAGAIVLARLRKVFIGARDPKSGACGTVLNILQTEQLNHRTEIEYGMMEQECSQMLKDFFRTLRARGKQHPKREKG